MTLLHVSLPDHLVKRLRVRVAELYDGKKGDLSRAVAEAIELWLKQKELSAKKK
jgi:Arc/MetJ-type ribon-helix-helix transcriptional regulator